MTIEIIRLVHPTSTGYHWFLIDRDNSHVFAQGHTKHFARAQNQATTTAMELGDTLGLEVVLSDDAS